MTVKPIPGNLQDAILFYIDVKIERCSTRQSSMAQFAAARKLKRLEESKSARQVGLPKLE